jgi:hypothetical protein
LLSPSLAIGSDGLPPARGPSPAFIAPKPLQVFAVDFNFAPEIKVLEENGDRAGQYAARSKTSINLFPVFVFWVIVGAVIWLIKELFS